MPKKAAAAPVVVEVPAEPALVPDEKPVEKPKRTRAASAYNMLLGEFMKKISLEEAEKPKEDRIPRNERMAKAQAMYREWKELNPGKGAKPDLDTKEGKKAIADAIEAKLAAVEKPKPKPASDEKPAPKAKATKGKKKTVVVESSDDE